MALVQKTQSKFGALVTMETTTYGSGTPALSAATDGFKIYESPAIETGMQFKGEREGATGTGVGRLTPVAPGGRYGKVSLMHYWKGPGVAYTGSSRSSFDRLVRMSGHTATVSGTTPNEICTYAPQALDGVLSSGVAELYARGQKWTLKGAYCNKFVIDAMAGLGVPKMTFDLAGILTSAPTDSAVPTITPFAPTIKNPKATALGFTFVTGGQTFTPICRGFRFTFEREMTERLDQVEATGSHAGYHLGDWTATLEVLFEATAVVTGSPFASPTAFDVYRVFENMGDVALVTTLGSVNYNQLILNGPTAHLSDFAKEEAEGPIATWNATFQLDPSTEDAADTHTLVTS